MCERFRQNNNKVAYISSFIFRKIKSPSSNKDRFNDSAGETLWVVSYMQLELTIMECFEDNRRVTSSE